MLTCSACGHENSDNMEFCEVCGTELSKLVDSSPPVIDPPNSDSSSANDFPVYSPSLPVVSDPAINELPSRVILVGALVQLTAKQANAPISKFSVDGRVIVGRFDPDTGPVDIDLEGFPGEETVSRNHAEIYREGNQWIVKDLGSANGVFIRRLGQVRFGAKIINPEALAEGDEIAFGKVSFLIKGQ